jgi:hypothetical protein
VSVAFKALRGLLLNYKLGFKFLAFSALGIKLCRDAVTFFVGCHLLLKLLSFLALSFNLKDKAVSISRVGKI